MLLSMPSELHEKIFLLCSTNDAKTLSCCSHQYYGMMKQYLWEAVSIPSQYLHDEDLSNDSRLELLQNVNIVCIGVHSSGEINEGLRGSIRPSYLRSVGKSTKTREKAKLDNFSILMQNCRARVLHTSFMPVVPLSKFPEFNQVLELHLYWGAVSNTVIRSICDHCNQLQVLSLLGGGLTDAGLSSLPKLYNLSQLSICNSTKITDSGMAVLSSLLKLEDLKLTGCSGLTRAVFNHLCSLKYLERFTVSGFGMFITNRELTKLSALVSLKEINTKLSTEITDEDFLELCKLARLEKLCLNHCVQVTDDALSNIRYLPNLRHLELCLSDRTEALHALQGSHLRTLVISRGYGVNDCSLLCISELVSLKQLSLIHCDEVTDKGISYLVNLTNLVFLELTYCGEVVTDAGFSNLCLVPKLEKLVIQGHPVHSSLECIAKILTLRELVLHNSNVTCDDGLKHLQNLSLLAKISIVDCDKITDSGFRYMCNMVSVKELSFNTRLPGSSTNLTDNALASLHSLILLQKLDLSNSRFLTDSSLSVIGKLQLVKHLSMRSCCKITDNGLLYLKKLEELEHLDLSACTNITDTGFAHIASLINLRLLDISSCRAITDHGIKVLSNLIGLQTLDCSYCELITDTGLEGVGSMCTLKELRMNNCPLLTNAGLNHLSDLFQLEKLSIVDCYGISGQGLHRYLRNPHSGINKLKHVPTIHY